MTDIRNFKVIEHCNWFKDRDICEGCFSWYKGLSYLDNTKECHFEYRTLKELEWINDRAVIYANQILSKIESRLEVKTPLKINHIKDIIRVSLDVLSHKHSDETKLLQVYSNTQRKAISIGLAKTFIDLISVKDKSYDRSILKGTKFNIPVMSDHGNTILVKDQKGYLKMDSYEGLQNEITRIVKLKKEGRQYDTAYYDQLLIWSGRININVLQHRSVEIYDVLIIFLMRYIPIINISPMLLRALLIYDELSENGNIPWAYRPNKKTYLLTDKAKKAPIMIGAYISDLLACDDTMWMGNVNSEIDLNDIVKTRDFMLKQGYFASVLKYKSVADIVFDVCSRDMFYKTALFNMDGTLSGIGSKKIKSIISAKDDIMSKLRDHPVLLKYIGKVSTTNELLLKHTSLTVLYGSCMYIWGVPLGVVYFSQHATPAMPIKDFYVTKRFIDGTPIDYNVPSDCEPLISIRNECAKKQRIVNFKEAFIESLTTRSAGEMLEEDYNRLSKRDQVAKVIMTKKVGRVAVASELFNDLTKYMRSLQLESSCVFRKQLLRRERGAVSIGMGQQLLYAGIGDFLKRMMSENEVYAGGKASAGIQTGMPQAVCSGNINGICHSADVKGFDTSLTQDLQWFIRSEVMKNIKSDVDINNDLFSIPTDKTEMEVMKEGITVDNYEVDVTKPYNLYRLVYGSNKNIKTKEDPSALFSIDTLSSGAGDTSGLGNAITGACANVIKANVQNNDVLIPRVQGDDFLLGQLASGDIEESMKESEQKIKEYFTKLGMVLESMSSTGFGTLLQITTCLGCFVSMQHRLTLWTSEKRPDKYVLEDLASTASIYDEACGRVHYVEELTRMMYRLSYIGSFVPTMGSIKIKNKMMHRSLKSKGGTFRLPLLTMYYKLRIPMPTLIINNNFISLPSSPLSLRGDTFFYEIYLRIINELDKSVPHMIKTYEDVVSKFKKLKQDMVNKMIGKYQEKGYSREDAIVELFNTGILYIDIFERINDDAYNYLNIKDVMLTYDAPTKISSQSVHIPEEVDILLRTYAQNYKEFHGTDKYNRSELGEFGLNQQMIKVPSSILYHERPYLRLSEMYKELNNSESWTAVIMAFDQHYNKTSLNRIKKEWARKMGMFDIKYTDSSTIIKDDILKKTLSALSVVPGTMYSNSTRVHVYRTSLRGNETVNYIWLFDSHFGRSYGSTNPDAWARILPQVKNASDVRKAINDLVMATGLPEKLRGKLEYSIYNNEYVGSNDLDFIQSERRQYGMYSNTQDYISRCVSSIERPRMSSKRARNALTSIIIGIESINAIHLNDKKLIYTVPNYWESVFIRPKVSSF